VLDEQAHILREQRARVSAALAALPGVRRVIPSDANFILFELAGGRGHPVFEFLRVSGILIKDVGRAGGMLTDHLRVTVGTPEENSAFLTALTEALRS